MKLSRIIFVLTSLLLMGVMVNDAQAGFVFSNSSTKLQSKRPSLSGMSSVATTQVAKVRSHFLDTLLWSENPAEKYAWGYRGTTSTTSSSVTQSLTNGVPAANLADIPRTTGSLITKIAEEPVPQSRSMPSSLFRPPCA